MTQAHLLGSKDVSKLQCLSLHRIVHMYVQSADYLSVGAPNPCLTVTRRCLALTLPIVCWAGSRYMHQLLDLQPMRTTCVVYQQLQVAGSLAVIDSSESDPC
jgi:hypothetical protein